MSRLIDTEKSLEEIIKSEKRVLVLFYASWCPFSRAFLPIFEKHAKSDCCCRAVTDDMEECEDKYSINVVPTVIYFEDGKVAKRLDGIPARGLDEKKLLEMLKACGV